MKLGIIGAGGYWGRKILQAATRLNAIDVRRCSANSNMGRLIEVVDAAFSGRRRPSVTLSHAELIRSPEIDALVIASPAETHYCIAKDALQNGKHIFVEKPMCLSSVEAGELAKLAEGRRRVLFVDHTYLHSKCIQYMNARVREGFLGQPLFLHSNRTQIGIYRDHGVLWDLAPHDLSIISFLFPEERIDRISQIPWAVFKHVGAGGGAHIPDAACYSISFASSFRASGFLAWCHPRWARDIAVVGTMGMLLFENNRTVKSFRCKSARCNMLERGEWQQQDEYAPDDNPLKNALESFCNLIERPGGDISWHLRPEFALRIIATIEAMEKSAVRG